MTSTPFAKEIARDVQINRLLPVQDVETRRPTGDRRRRRPHLLQQLDTSTGITNFLGFIAQVMIQAPSATLTIGNGAVIRATGNSRHRRRPRRSCVCGPRACGSASLRPEQRHGDADIDSRRG